MYRRILALMVYTLMTLNLWAQNLPLIDSLHQRLRFTENDSARIFLLSEISYQWCGINFDSSYKYAKRCYDLSLSKGTNHDIGLGLTIMGFVFDYDYQFDSGRYYYHKALKHSRIHQDVKREATSLFNIGVIFYYEGKLDSALKYYLMSEPIFESLSDLQNLSRLYNNLGRIYEKTNQLEYALQVSRNSIAIKESLEDTRGLLNTYTNMSSIFQRMDLYDSALVYSSKCINKAREIGDMIAYKAELVNLGIIYINLENMARAFASFDEAESLINDQDGDYVKTQVYHNLGQYFFQERNWSQTNYYLEKTREFLLEEDYLETAMHHYHLAYAFFKETGDNTEAVRNLEKYVELREKFLGEETLRQTNELEQLYEKENRELEIERLNAENQLQALGIEKRSRERNGLLIVSILIVGVAILLWVLYKQIQKSLHERETLLKEIHHRVKNNLQVISSLLNLQADSLSDEAAITAVQAGQHRVRSMALIHQKLYQDQDIRGVDAQEYLDNLTEELFSAFDIDNETIQYQIDSSGIKLDIDTIIPLGLIINELVTNSLKYAFIDKKSGKLIIRLKEFDNKLHVEVSDDGVGFNEKEIAEKNSFGWKMIQSLGRKLKAEINILNDNGTKVIMTLSRYKLVV